MAALMIDVGNSAIKWAVLTEKGLSAQRRLLYRQEAINLVLAQIATTDTIDAVWISSVVSMEITHCLTEWSQNKWYLTPTFAKTSAEIAGIKNGYNLPEQLGIDRWLTLLAARHLVTGPLCILDCGTAVTLDILSSEDQHKGGLIMPGLKLMRDSLTRGTYALERFSVAIPTTVGLARDTEHAITLGTLYAVVGWLEYVLSTFGIKEENFKLILTGGDAPTFGPLLHRPYQYIPDLVLQGLVILTSNPQPSKNTSKQ